MLKLIVIISSDTKRQIVSSIRLMTFKGLRDKFLILRGIFLFSIEYLTSLFSTEGKSSAHFNLLPIPGVVKFSFESVFEGELFHI